MLKLTGNYRVLVAQWLGVDYLSVRCADQPPSGLSVLTAPFSAAYSADGCVVPYAPRGSLDVQTNHLALTLFGVRTYSSLGIRSPQVSVGSEMANDKTKVFLWFFFVLFVFFILT